MDGAEPFEDDYGEEVETSVSKKVGIPRKKGFNLKDAGMAKPLFEKILDVQFYESGWFDSK